MDNKPLSPPAEALNSVETNVRRPWVQTSRPTVFVLTAALAALVLSLLAFAPHFWLWHQPVEGSFEWTRGLSFAAQVANPSSPAVEPALQWRCLPAAVARHAGLKGHAVFLVGWFGVIALLAGVAGWTLDHTRNRRASFAAALLVAESSAVIVPTGWLGINDAWAWLGLAAVVFTRRCVVFAAALLLSPWVDERFLLALPLALWARQLIVGKEPMLRQLVIAAVCLGPYVLLRVWAAYNGSDASSGTFITNCLAEFRHYAPCAPLGWWMAWRLAWLLPVFGAWLLWKDGKLWSIAVALATAGAGLAFVTILAADLSRSAAMLLPGMLVSLVLITKLNPSLFSGRILALAGVNLLVPAAHVVSTKFALISCLPVELWRWMHS